MNLIKKIIRGLATQHSFVKDVFILLIITRLMFLENNQLVLIAEIISSFIFLTTKGQELQKEE